MGEEDEAANMAKVKLVAIGDSAVGKTCLLISYATNTFPADYVPTVFDNHNINVVVDGDSVNLELWDTAGQSDYDKLRPLGYPDTDVFLLCYSVMRMSSLDNIVTKWKPEIDEWCPDAPFLLVGCQNDLRKDEKAVARAEEIVTPKQAESVKNAIRATASLECSALTQEDLTEVFAEAVRVGSLQSARASAGGGCGCVIF